MIRKLLIILVLGMVVYGNSVKYSLSVTGVVNCEVDEGRKDVFEFGSYYNGSFIKNNNIISDSVVVSKDIGIVIKAFVSIDSIDNLGIICSTRTERVGIKSFSMKSMKLKRNGEVIFDFLKEIGRIDAGIGYRVEKIGDSVVIFAENVKRSDVGINIITIEIEDSIVLMKGDSLDIDYDYEMYFIEKESRTKNIVRCDNSKKNIIKTDKNRGDLLGRKVGCLKKDIRSNCIIDYNKKIIWFK